MSGLGNKEIFSRNLRTYMELHGKDRNNVCDDLGFKYTTFNDWYNGKKYPRIDKIEMLANYFGIMKSDLIEDDKPVPTSTAVRIPVLGDVAAGIPIEAIEDIIDYEEIDAAMAASGEFFGLRIRGASMEPRMLDGDVVIVRKQDDVNSGDTAVVMVNGDSATVKKLRKGADGITLIPNNPSYDLTFYSVAEVESLPVRVIGKVIELRGKF